MFQYAAGKALAERHRVKLRLDVSRFRDYPLRTFLLDRFCLPEHETICHQSLPQSASHESSGLSGWSRIKRSLRSNEPQKLQTANQYSEPHFHYDPAFEQLGSNVALFGYFQSELYFHNISGMLSGWFGLRERLGEAASAVATAIGCSKLSVSVHIRRGDYTKREALEVHGILNESYYKRALSILESKLGAEADFFVFSDDLAEAERVLSFVPSRQLIFVRGDSQRPWEDMALMARCQHHAIANSSFSWWGAWLNRSSQKIVVAPRAWFSPSGLRERNTCDLCPSSWILV